MIYDIIIVGSGPAGVTAAIYACRAKKSVLVIEKEAFGGMITHSPKVENYPGYDSISGIALADKFVGQAMDLGVRFEFDTVLEINKGEDDIFTAKGEFNTYQGKTVILATGSKHRTLKLENEDKLVGKGISYCAVCDGPFYTNQDVAIVGGGNSAMQEALLLASYCKSVTIIQNLGFFTGEHALKEQIEKTENIKVLFNKVVTGLIGTTSLESIVLKDQITSETEVFKTNSLFVAIGQEANNKPFENIAKLNEQGFIETDEMCNTFVEGVYAAGDCRVKKIRQIVTANADGSISALQAIKYLDSKN